MSRKPVDTPSLPERARLLSERQNLKMARSAHAYVRGSTAKFYEWLESSNRVQLPEGPTVWICGDCHVGNLGPVANVDRDVEIQIRDLDQTVIGNPAHDLIRLALSLATAARGSDLPGVTTARMLEEMVQGYELALGGEAEKDVGRPEAVKLVLRDALGRKWRHLARERIQDLKPLIPLGKQFWAISDEERQALETLFAGEAVHTLVTALRGRDLHEPVRVLDAAYWRKGCSSLGRLRYAVLVGVGEEDPERHGLALIDVKEAVQAAAPRSSGAKMPRDNGERVVQGARHLSPHLGERMATGGLQGRSVFLRELMPQDLKLEIEQLTCAEAVKTARYLAWVVGAAHARQMDAPTRNSWQAELGRHRLKTVDAPSWLWASVVELVAQHEAAYLEHCRLYAMQSAA